MSGRFFDEEMAEEADALQAHFDKQLSEKGPHPKLLEILRRLREFEARWVYTEEIVDAEQLKASCEVLFEGLVPTLEKVLGVSPE